MVPRHADWEDRLDSFVADRMHRPFTWGANDCFFFVAGAVKEMSGMDITHWIEGKYSTKFGAIKESKKLGCRSIDEAEVKILDEVMVRETLARKPVYGDIILARIKNLDPTHAGSTIGIVSGSVFQSINMLVPGRDGLVAATLASDVEAVWTF